MKFWIMWFISWLGFLQFWLVFFSLVFLNRLISGPEVNCHSMATSVQLNFSWKPDKELILRLLWRCFHHLTKEVENSLTCDVLCKTHREQSQKISVLFWLFKSAKTIFGAVNIFHCRYFFFTVFFCLFIQSLFISTFQLCGFLGFFLLL